MKGMAYGIGVGPGDPELITMKAARLIREADVIAVPGEKPGDSVAYRTALKVVGEMSGKETVALGAPMSMDKDSLSEAHRRSADIIEGYLDKGLNVAFLTLGDPAVYSTFMYIRDILDTDGYETGIVSGVTSFCAAAARLGISLASWDEEIRILPALHCADDLPNIKGSVILMKPGRRYAEIRDHLKECGFEAAMIENCGMEGEKVFERLCDFPEEAGYFSLIIAKRDKE